MVEGFKIHKKVEFRICGKFVNGLIIKKQIISAMEEDIREISGYARDTTILDTLGVDKDDTKEIKCLIIYPNEEKEEEANFSADEHLLCRATKIQDFRGFYKLCIPLPEKKGG